MASDSCGVRPNLGASNFAYSPVRAALAFRNASELDRPAARSVRMMFWYSAMRRPRSALRSISVFASRRPEVRSPLLSLSIDDSHVTSPTPAGGSMPRGRGGPPSKRRALPANRSGNPPSGGSGGTGGPPPTDGPRGGRPPAPGGGGGH